MRASGRLWNAVNNTIALRTCAFVFQTMILYKHKATPRTSLLWLFRTKHPLILFELVLAIVAVPGRKLR